MSSADTVRSLALSLVGLPYRLGEEFWFAPGGAQTAEMDGDCSGLVYAVYRKAGVLVDGKPLPRETAHSYYLRSQRIAQPSRVGDLGFLLRDGHVYHTFMYVGEGQVVEAGDGTGHVGLRTVAHENSRGCVWGRLNTDITEGDDMTPDEVRAIVREEVDIIYSIDVADAQKYLEERGIVGRRHKASLAASVGYVDLIVARVLKKVLKGTPDD